MVGCGCSGCRGAAAARGRSSRRRPPQRQRESIWAFAGGAGCHARGVRPRMAISRRGRRPADRRPVTAAWPAPRVVPAGRRIERDPQAGRQRISGQAGDGRADVRSDCRVRTGARVGGGHRPARCRLCARPSPDAGGRRGPRLRLQSQQPHGERDAEGPDGRVPPGIVERGAGRRGLPPLRGRSGLRERPAAGEDAPRPDRDAHVLEDLRHGRSPARICGRAASGDREARSAGGVGFGQRDRPGRGAGERGRRSLGGAGPQAKRSHPRSGRCRAGPARVHRDPLAGELRDDRHAARGETADRGVAPARRRGRPAVPGNAQTPARHSGKCRAPAARQPTRRRADQAARSLGRAGAGQ